MRMRRSKHVEEHLASYPGLIIQPEELTPDFFEGEVHMEIGMGKGGFLHQKASHYPEINFLGIDKNIMAISKSRLKFDGLSNVKIIHHSLDKIMEHLEDGSIDVIYLNFSDPWPKSKHYKRRLTYRDMLALYAKLLKTGGEVHVKTDSESLFEFSLEEVKESHFDILKQTRNLYDEPIFKDHFPTEYERKFVAKGLPIYGLLLKLGEKHD